MSDDLDFCPECGHDLVWYHNAISAFRPTIKCSYENCHCIMERSQNDLWQTVKGLLDSVEGLR